MEILTKIWTALSTENELLTKIIGLPFILLEMYVYMCLFTTILDIKSTKKQKIIYIVLSSLVGILCSLVIPKPYSNIITIIYTPLAIMFIFKVSFLKGIFSEFLILICVTVSELIITRLFFMVTGISYDIFANIPIYRLLATLSIYLLIYLISRIAMKWNLIINIWDNISKHNKKVILTNLIFALAVMFMQMYLIGYYNDKLPLFTILVNVLSLLAYFGISIFSLIKTMKLEKTMVDLEELIEDAKLRKQGIEMESISLENIYEILKTFEEIYDIMDDKEQKTLITYLIKEIQINPNDQNDCVMPLKSIEFNFPLYKGGKEVRKIFWETQSSVETLVTLYRK